MLTGSASPGTTQAAPPEGSAEQGAAPPPTAFEESRPAENGSMPPAENGAVPQASVSDASTNIAQTDAPAGETAILSGDGLLAAAVLQNQWEADGREVYQYSLTVTNTAQSGCARWKIELSFAQEFTLLDGWNGDYTVRGNTLLISGKDYNGALDPGGSAADIGFIVAGGGRITVE